MNSSSPDLSKKTLLVGWEGVDWSFLRSLCEKGALPSLTGITRAGVSTGLQARSPYLSPILWNSLVTGKRSWRHGVHGPTQVDAQGAIGPVSSRNRRVPALWEMFSQEGLRTIVVGGYASHPVEPGNGISVSERFFAGPRAESAPAQSVWPPELAEEIEGLRVNAASLAPSILRLLIPKITQTLVERDPRVRRLVAYVAKLYSRHNVAASLIETEPWNFAAAHFPFLGEMFSEFGSFTFPRHSGVSRGAFERYSEVLEGACRLQDLLLHDLLRAAGPETTVFVVSDRGFQPSSCTPATSLLPGGYSLKNGPEGLLAACGPGIAVRPGILSGADLLDVAPTILQIMGLPVGNDMDGRVLREILTKDAQNRINRIPSWDTRVKDSVQACDPAPAGPPCLNEQEGTLPSEAEETLYLQNGWNEGMDLLDAGLLHRALPLLEQAAWTSPEVAHYRFWLALCQARLGLMSEAWETTGTLDDLGERLASTQRLKAILSIEMRQPERAMKHLEAALARQKDEPGDLGTLKALALQQSGKWLEALEILRPEAVRSPSIDIWLGIAHCCLSLKRPWAAVSAAHQLLLTNPCHIGYWLLLTRCLVANGKADDGWNALLKAQQMKPGLSDVRSLASQLFPERRNDWHSWTLVHGTGETDPPPGMKELRAGIQQRKATRERYLSQKRHSQPLSRYESGSIGSLPKPLTGMASGIPYTYRAPFPDEEKRALELLKKHPPMMGESFLRVWETPNPRRLAGAALWAAPKADEPDKAGEVRFHLLPGFCKPEVATELLRPLFAEIRASHCRRVRVLMAEQGQWEFILNRFGLAGTARDEIWLADAVSGYERTQIAAARWEKKIPSDWKARNITDSDWEFIWHKSGVLDYLSATNLERVRRELDGGISCVVESSTGIVGVLLATRFEMTAVLEFLGVARDASRQASWVAWLALTHFCRRSHPDPFDFALASTNPNKGNAARSLFRRSGGTLLQVVDHFTGELSEPGPEWPIATGLA